ncbi:transposase [Roseinatronobacter monicus]|uniref:transposase n=1 Tax=Roseinatronobacter monicus TaxID=393481 RepID=UPI003F396C9A
MKTSRYTETQIIAMLRQVEGSVPVALLCCELGMSDVSFQKWCAKHACIEAFGSAYYSARELI